MDAIVRAEICGEVFMIPSGGKGPPGSTLLRSPIASAGLLSVVAFEAIWQSRSESMNESL